MKKEYRKVEFFTYHALRKIINDNKKSENIRDKAKYILDDKKRFEDYVLLKIELRKAEKRKKVLENAKKNLTGWKKWFKIILPERLILG